jgi:ubiquinone/menaquinone biosynthesis C-methylase UbiE
MARIEISKEDFLKFVDKQLKQFPRCKIDEYKDIKYNRHQNYKNVKSKQQINTILNIKQNKIGLYHYNRLLQLLSKDIKFYDYFNLLKIFKKSKFDDLQVYKFLQKFKAKKMSSNCCSRKCGSRSDLFSQIFGTLFKRFFTGNRLQIPITNYLDIGCGDCKQTKVLGNIIGLPDSEIYGADISNWGEYNKEKRNKIGINIVDLKEDGILPFEDSKFCLISVFMVLHHVRPIEKLLSEISRILKPNGYFFIREHDAMSKIDYMLCDIEHALYDVVQRNDMTYFDKYHGVYYDWLEWDYILQKHGLKYLSGDFNSNSIYYNLSPNRSFYGVYYKV